MTERYVRQSLLPKIGLQGQKKLLQARLLIVGCGALGTAQALLLSRAGFGFLRIVDDDRVELCNLHRQILFDEEDARLGRMKVHCAAEHLRQGNSEIIIEAIAQRFDDDTASAMLQDIDLVLDASDNFSSRFAINRACVATRTSWIYGGAIGHEGMMMPIRPGDGPCLRCMMEKEPASTKTAAEFGVLNSLTTTIAAMQVQTALRHVIADPMPSGQLLRWNVWDLHMQKIHVSRRRDCACCADI